MPAAIKAVDQDIDINAPVRYTIQSRILPFLDLNPETAEIVMIRSLQDSELMTSATIIIKVKKYQYVLVFQMKVFQQISNDNNDIIYKI